MAKVYFYYSAMNAGKSTTLLQASYNYLERGMQTLLFTARLDTRGPKATINSRIGLMKEAICFDKELNFYDYVEERTNIMDNLKCILIDECQFLSKIQIHELTDIANHLGIAVLCYGLRTDFTGEPFEGSKYLLALAEELIEIKTICECGRKATMNLRIDGDGKAITKGNQIQIGGNESYTSKCMRCYTNAMSSNRRENALEKK